MVFLVLTAIGRATVDCGGGMVPKDPEDVLGGGPVVVINGGGGGSFVPARVAGPLGRTC
jgi:hypothetical protein